MCGVFLLQQVHPVGVVLLHKNITLEKKKSERYTVGKILFKYFLPPKVTQVNVTSRYPPLVSLEGECRPAVTKQRTERRANTPTPLHVHVCMCALRVYFCGSVFTEMLSLTA